MVEKETFSIFKVWSEYDIEEDVYIKLISTLFTYIQRTNYGKVINNLMSYCPIRKVWPQNNAIMYFERNKELCK